MAFCYRGAFQSLRQPTVRLWSFFFNETFRISYCELDKHVGLLRINFGTILKNYIFIIVTPINKFLCDVRTCFVHRGVAISLIGLTAVVFCWFLSGLRPDTRLARCIRRKIKHSPTMTATVALPPPWFPAPGAAAHNNQPT